MNAIFNISDTKNNQNALDSIQISIASPERIIEESCGEVERPDTVNYRTEKPEFKGLFCARIFGSVKDFECLCGKYRRRKYAGVVCEKCGVEVTSAKVRRQRMGHITLAAPVVHIWFLRSLPSKIGTLLDMPLKDIEKIIYFESFVVLDPGVTPLQKYQIISDEEREEYEDNYGEDAFTAEIGAEAIRKMLGAVNLEEESVKLREELYSTNSETRRKKIIKRLRLVDDFRGSENNPEWMVLKVLPVIPPDLRPIVMLEGGRFATSDLNELLRRVVIRNNRLKRLYELKAPRIIIHNEIRMLQESVDAYLDNTRKKKVHKSSNKRPYKSLADMLRGKHGRFRQNLLGKRVDYSGRSVIVVGPSLKLHQCGLPKEMALELFKPFVYSKLELYGIANTLKVAKKLVEQEKPEVWDVLEEVIREHPVLLNRAPTLHRLGIQAFEPILIEGKAIQLHPLVCHAFNADFDGDQMAVHVPLSLEAQLEARVLMMSTNNIMSPGSGKPIIVPSQDIVLGLYYISLMLNGEVGEDTYYNDIAEIEQALDHKVITINTRIKFRYSVADKSGKQVSKLVETTAGRVFIYELLPKHENLDFDLINQLMTDKMLAKVIDAVYRIFGKKNTVIFCDKIMELGFKYACKSGISMGINDMVVPDSKLTHLKEVTDEVRDYESQYIDGFITSGEKYNKVVDAWSSCAESITNDMMNEISKVAPADKMRSINRVNSIYMMAHSGARGSRQQMKQLSAMIGLKVKPSGEIIETPIKSNYKEGLTADEYFDSTHGARKGSADTALKTAISGYLARKMVERSQDCIIVEEDCGTTKGIEVKAIVESGEVIVPLSELILGRCVLNDVYHPSSEKLLIPANTLIDENNVKLIEDIDIDSIMVRSVLTCDSKKSTVCAKCYGRDLATGNLVNTGEAVGVIAAQSIGEPGTQLTMNTFHLGGTAQKNIVQSNIISSVSGNIRYVNDSVVENSEGAKVVMSRNCELSIEDDKRHEKAHYKVPYGAKLFYKAGSKVKKGALLVEWDPYTVPIISGKSGYAKFVDMVEGVSVKEIVDDATGIASRIVIDWRQYSRGNNLRPRIELYDENGEQLKFANGADAKYFIPTGAILSINDKAFINAGDILAKTPKETSKSKDITGGLPRVIELFEARAPKDQAVLAEIDGYIEFGKDYKSKRRIIITPLDESIKSREYLIPRGQYVTVNEGDLISKGDQITEGSPSPHDILRILGLEALSEHVINEVQQVYRLQGVKIDNKHIEVLLRQMLQKVEIVDAGDTTYIVGEYVDKEVFEEMNQEVVESGRKPAKGVRILQGITRASLQTKSFISAASFQETTRVLTDAAAAAKKDPLEGLKENIIVGRLIPAGTGFYLKKMREEAKHRDLEFEKERAKQQELESEEIVAAEDEDIRSVENSN